MKRICIPLIALLVSVVTIVRAQEPSSKMTPENKATRVETPAPTKPPLQPADITKLPEGTVQRNLGAKPGAAHVRRESKFWQELPPLLPRASSLSVLHLRWTSCTRPRW